MDGGYIGPVVIFEYVYHSCGLELVGRHSTRKVFKSENEYDLMKPEINVKSELRKENDIILCLFQKPKGRFNMRTLGYIYTGICPTQYYFQVSILAPPFERYETGRTFNQTMKAMPVTGQTNSKYHTGCFHLGV